MYINLHISQADLPVNVYIVDENLVFALVHVSEYEASADVNNFNTGS